MAIAKRVRAVATKFCSDTAVRLCFWAVIIVIVSYFVGNL